MALKDEIEVMASSFIVLRVAVVVLLAAAYGLSTPKSRPSRMESTRARVQRRTQIRTEQAILSTEQSDLDRRLLRWGSC
jgi:hypothetical protein